MSIAVTQIPTGLVYVYLASLVFFVVTIRDMARRPQWQWQQAGSNKVLWIVVEAISVIGLLSVVVGALYFAIARPRLMAAERAGAVGAGLASGTQSWQDGGLGAGPVTAPWGPPPETGASTEAGGPPRFPTSVAPPPAPPFGWYPDPSSRHEMRYWDGTRWTEHVSDHGAQTNDPLPGPA